MEHKLLRSLFSEAEELFWKNSTRKAQRPKDAKMESELSGKIIGAAIEVHRTLGGPGLFESIYEAALCHELMLQGIKYERQLPVQVVYKGMIIRDPLYIDILVRDTVIVEVKATEKITLFTKRRFSPIFG